jgi:hypothetical protein
LLPTLSNPPHPPCCRRSIVRWQTHEMTVRPGAFFVARGSEN